MKKILLGFAEGYFTV